MVMWLLWLLTLLWLPLFPRLLTYSVEQSPSWEANRFSASQEIPRVLWNPKVHYLIHTYPFVTKVTNVNMFTLAANDIIWLPELQLL